MRDLSQIVSLPCLSRVRVSSSCASCLFGCVLFGTRSANATVAQSPNARDGADDVCAIGSEPARERCALANRRSAAGEQALFRSRGPLRLVSVTNNRTG